MATLESTHTPVGFEILSAHQANQIEKTKKRLEKVINNQKNRPNSKVLKLKNADAYLYNVKLAKSDPIRIKLSPKAAPIGNKLGEVSIFSFPQRKYSQKKIDFHLSSNQNPLHHKRSLSPLNYTLHTEPTEVTGMYSVKLPPLSHPITKKYSLPEVEVKQFVFNTKDLGSKLNSTEDELSADPVSKIRHSAANILSLFKKNVSSHTEQLLRKDASSPKLLETKPDTEYGFMPIGHSFDKLALFTKKSNALNYLNKGDAELKTKPVKLVKLNERKPVDSTPRNSTKVLPKPTANALKSVTLIENPVLDEPFNFKTSPLARNGEFSPDFSPMIKMNLNKQVLESFETAQRSLFDPEADERKDMGFQKHSEKLMKLAAAVGSGSKTAKTLETQINENDADDDYDLREYLDNQREVTM